MNEIEYKLNTNNSVLVVNAIGKLISTIKSQYKPEERQKFVLENEELKYLREKCKCEETVVSLTACQGLLALVESGVLEIAHTMSTMITMLPSANNHSAILSTMSGLLVLSLKSRIVPGQPYTCQFSLRSPQHPFISVLESNSSALHDVLAQMHAICTHPDHAISSNGLELLRPVLMWLTCCPAGVKSCAAAGTEPWNLMLSLPHHRSQNALLMDCLTWQQFCDPNLIESTFAAYSAVMDNAIYRQDQEFVVAMMPVLARISNKLIKHGKDPRTCYSLMLRGLELEIRPASGLVLLLLAENLPISCAPHLHQLFTLGLTIITKYELPLIVLNAFAAMSLQWMHQPSCLTVNALSVAAKILELQRTRRTEERKLNMPNLLANKRFRDLIHTDVHLYVMVNVLKRWEMIEDSQKSENWLDDLEKLDCELRLELVPFLLGFVMDDNSSKLCLRALKIVLGSVEGNKELTVQLLPILLYKVANAVDPLVRLECLKGIPLMAVTKENVPTIVAILNSLRSGKCVPGSLLISLHCDLAEVQVRCYPYLQELLAEGGAVRGDDTKWELEAAIAEAVRRLCDKRAETHGRELVPVLSGVLNRSAGAGGGGGAGGAALEALGALWERAVVAPPGTWRALRPKLARDTRPYLRLSLCKLLSKVPSLRVDTPDYDKLLVDTAEHLWNYIAESNWPPVVEAACDALSEYLVSDYPLRAVPAVYRRSVKLPPAHCKTPSDAARKPEDVLDYVPCEVWPEVFKYTASTALEGVVRLVGGLMAREVSAYRGCTRLSPGHLPPHSVVRGMLVAIQKEATNPTPECPDEVLAAMMRSAARDHTQPLPQQEMGFLRHCRGRPQLRPHALRLAARQATISESAALYLTEYLDEMRTEELEASQIEMFVSLLPRLVCSVAPNDLRTPIDRCMEVTFNQVSTMKARDHAERTDDLMFPKVLAGLRYCLLSEDTHEANRTLISQALERYMMIIPEDNVSWASYEETCCHLPRDTLERMSTPSSWWEVNSARLRRAARIRCTLAAMTPAPDTHQLAWLNEIVDSAATSLPDHAFVLEHIAKCLSKCVLTEASREWFLELLARTQFSLAKSEVESEKQFLCSVVVEAAVALSGLRAVGGREAGDGRLSPALYHMFAGEHGSQHIPRIVEWLLHTRQSRGMVDAHRSLQAVRSHSYFSRNGVWGRVLSYTIPE